MFNPPPRYLVVQGGHTWAQSSVCGWRTNYQALVHINTWYDIVCIGLGGISWVAIK